MLAQGVFEVLRLHLQNFGPIRLCDSRGHDDFVFHRHDMRQYRLR